MALEPAGVNLEAKGFQDYFRKLEQIEKKQKDVFDTKFSGTEKSFNQVSRSANQYQKELDKLASAERRAASEARKLAAAEQTAAATRRQAIISTGNAILDIGKQIATFSFESAKLSAQFGAQQQGVQNLAESFGQSGNAIVAAIRRASSGTVSGLQAIQAANQGLLLGVAQTPEEFETLTRAALTLGRTLGLTADQALEQFTTALGRQSVLILDNFGISAKQVNAEIERLANVQFGKARSELSEAQKSALFMEAALKLAGEAAETIGDGAESASASFARLDAQSQDLQVTFGKLVEPLAVGVSDSLSRAGRTAQQVFAFVGAGIAGIRSASKGIFDNIFGGGDAKGITQLLDEATDAATDRFKDIAGTIAGVDFGEENIKASTQALEEQGEAIEDNTDKVKALESALEQAQTLQLQFAREAEDQAIKRARQQEDINRKQTRQIARLDAKQGKDRDKLLQRQQKRLDEFEAKRGEQIQQAEKAVAKERAKAREDRLKAERDLQNRLKQQRDRFNLSQLQSERRFSVQEKRLRAAGDILGLQQLREDFDLQKQEEKENFDLSQKDTAESGKAKIKEQTKNAEERLRELTSNLDQERVKLLASFDEQFADLQASQLEARQALKENFDLQAQDRAIALQREEEDRRLGQARQLEDLGRSFAQQEAITEQGASKIAAKLEEFFGIEGSATNIMTGFTERTTEEFKGLFEELEKEIAPSREIQIDTRLRAGLGATGSQRIGGLQEFDEGGVVAGPPGSPQIVRAHAGETILPTHKRSVVMAAPVIPSQTLNVRMAGGFNITGADGVSEAAKEAAMAEMADTFELAVNRLVRRN